jgi:hypothetical protein
MQNPFEAVHLLAGEYRLSRKDKLLPVAQGRVADLEGALRALILAGDSLKIPAKEHDRWHAAALAAEGVLNAHEAAP